MATTYYADIQKLYVAYFNRPGDFGGLAYWETVMEANHGSPAGLAAISSSFAGSAEYQAEYGNKDYYAVVKQIYNNLFNRDPEVDGLQYWVKGLTKGDFTVADAVRVISSAAGDDGVNNDKTTFANKVAAAEAFSNDLNTSARISGYAGTEANVEAKHFLSTVTDDPATLQNALDNIDASVDAAVYAHDLAAAPSYTLAEALAATSLPKIYKLSTSSVNLGSHLTVAQVGAIAAHADQVIAGAANGANLNLNPTYSLQDTLANIKAADPELLAGAASYALNDAVINLGANLSTAQATAAWNAAQGLVNGATNHASLVLAPTYTLADTLANLSANPTLASGAANYKLTDAAGDLGLLTAAQIALVNGATDKALYTYQTQGLSYALTGNIDTLLGTSGNDTFTASSADGHTLNLGTFDTIDGAAGVDVLNVTMIDPVNLNNGVSVTVRNIEATNITSLSTVQGDVSGWTGLKTVNVAEAGGNGGGSVKAAGTTAVTLADSAQGAGNISVSGGSNVSVASASVGTGTITVAGAKGTVAVTSVATAGTQGLITINGGTSISVTETATNSTNNTTVTQGDVAITGDATTTTVSVKEAAAVAAGAGTPGIGSGAITISDLNNANTDGSKANTITAVMLDTYGTTTINSNALANLSLANSGANVSVVDHTATVTNKSLTVALNKISGGTLTDATITTLNLVAGGAASTVGVAGAALTNLNISGDQKLTVSANPASLTSLVSSNTAGVTVTLNNSTAATFGDGTDNVTVGASTKAVSLGNGNDVLTLTANLGNGGAVDGGAGADIIAGTSAVLAGVNTSGLTNFESIEVTDSLAAAIDVTKISSTVKVVNLDAATTGGAAVNFAAGSGTLNLKAPAGAAFAVSSNGNGTTDSVTIANAAASVNVGNVATAQDAFNGQNITATGVETLTLDGTGTGAAKTQTVGNITTTASANGMTTVKFAGSNAFSTGVITANTVDASGLSAAFSATGDNALTTIGSTGNDTITLTAATKAGVAANGNNPAVPSIDATVSTGTGNDTVTVNTGAAATNTGMITIDTGAGNDTVNVTTRTTGKLVVMLGDGNDTFNSAVAVNGTDVIDAGNGIDTLQLKLVGASNIGAFSNFDAFDAAAMGAVTLDVDILATKNTVTEFVATATTGGATLINIGAGVGFRATGDMGNDQINLTQKAAGALTVTADIDEAAANQAGNTVTAGAHATNATSLNAVFGSDFKDANTGGNNPTPVINVTNLNLTGDAATSLNVTSGGALSTNTLNYTDTNHKLTSLTVTGSDVLTLSLTGTTALANVNASGDTGGVHLNYTGTNCRPTRSSPWAPAQT